MICSLSSESLQHWRAPFSQSGRQLGGKKVLYSVSAVPGAEVYQQDGLILQESIHVPC